MDDDKLSGAGRSNVIPGHTMGWFRDHMLGACTVYFRDKALDEATRSAGRHTAAYLAKYPDPNRRPPTNSTEEEQAANAAMAQFTDAKQFGFFNWNRPFFYPEVDNIDNLPFLLWTSLRVAEPSISLADAKALIKPENEEVILTNLKELMGYDTSKKVGVLLHRRKRGWDSPTLPDSSASGMSQEAKSPS